MNRHRAPDAGFTLIETLVALAILALSAVALLGATERHIARIGALETRAAGQWALENRLAEATLGIEPVARPAPIYGIAYEIGETRAATSDPDLAELDLTATEVADGRTVARLTGFLDTGAKPPALGLDLPAPELPSMRTRQ